MTEKGPVNTHLLYKRGVEIWCIEYIESVLPIAINAPKTSTPVSDENTKNSSKLRVLKIHRAAMR